MALNIKNERVDHLLDQVVQLTGESKTEVVRKALEERQQRLALGRTEARTILRLHMFLQDEVWPQIPPNQRGVRLSKPEEEAILGYGEAGV